MFRRALNPIKIARCWGRTAACGGAASTSSISGDLLRFSSTTAAETPPPPADNKGKEGSNSVEGKPEAPFPSPLRVEPSPAMDDIVIFHLENTPVNTLSPDLLNEFNEALMQHGREDSPTKGIIVTSGIQNIFSAGLDFNILYDNLNEETFVRYWSLFQEMWILLHGHPKPVFAAINGQCPAAGCILSMACDYRVMARGSGDSKYRIGITAAKAGFCAPKWVASGLETLVGSRTADRLLTTGALIPPDAAMSCGLIDEVVDEPEQALVAAHVEMEKWLQTPGPCRWLVKDHMRRPLLQMLESKEQRVKDTADFFIQLSHPTIKDRLGEYVTGLRRRGPGK